MLGGRAVGFSLLELLVVLALLGLATGVVLPRLQTLYDGLSYSLSEARVLGGIAELGFRAHKERVPILLGSTEVGEPLIELPAGWSLAAKQPVKYAANGVCAGGNVTIVSPRGSKNYQLRPPFCRPQHQ